jgi:radical SAM superfamily enzyme YgiQ (UPF0313 family)
MKITFLIPPAVHGRAPERLFGCNYGVYFQPNIFMLYPAATLEQAGHAVSVIDCPVHGYSQSWFEGFLKTDNSDIYVFYTPFLAEAVDKAAFKLVRQVMQDVVIIFFGPEPTARPENFLLDGRTFVIRGEAETAMPELIRELVGKRRFDKILGLSWKKDNKLVHNPPRQPLKNLDILPLPARHLIDRDLYYNPKLRGRPSTVMLTSRGCWGRCIYCIPCSYMFAREIEGKRYFGCKPAVSLRSAKNIIKEFRQLKDEGYKSIAIIDDNFINGKERTIEICEGIRDLGLEWGCLARADCLLDEEIVRSMAKAGCVYIDIGVESFDQRALDYIHKDLTAEQILTAIQLLKKYNIEPKINILFGTYPYETEADIRRTVEVLKKMNIEYVTFSVLIPHPQTEFYKIAKSNGFFTDGDFRPADPLRQATISYKYLGARDYERLVRWAYRSYYLRPSYIWKKLRKVRSFRELFDNIVTAWNLFRRG